MQHFEETAIGAAKEAGNLIRARLGAYAELDTKLSAHDLVTDVDRASEQIISQYLLSRFPDHALLGEEGVNGAAREDAEYTWVVDPIDGTMNFVHGIPFVSVSIALARRGELVVGVVYDVMRDEVFHGRLGGGAFVNGKPLAVSKQESLEASLLATGFSTLQEYRHIDVKALGAFSNYARNVRAMGSAALHMAYVAAGRLEGFWEHQLNAWDLSAGALLIREAGGRVTDMAGREYTLPVRHVVASNGRIHDRMLAILDEVGSLHG